MKASCVHPAPSVDEAVLAPEGFRVLDLPALLRMKLTSFRDIDRVHVQDLLEIGLLTAKVRAALPADLRQSLEDLEKSRADDED